MAYDRSEEERPLTEAEKRRLEKYEILSEEMEEKGYRKTELTVGLKRANSTALVVFLPFAVVFFFLFFYRNSLESFKATVWTFLILIVAFLVLTVVHELLHGIVWGLLAQHKFKDIEFGYIKESFTPYCTCTTPLKRGAYLVGVLTPFVLLGLIPCVISIFNGSFRLLILGLCMIAGAGGDVLIALKVLKRRSQARDILYYDHPTKAGSVVFELD